jgi:hypothetical protein
LARVAAYSFLMSGAPEEAHIGSACAGPSTYDCTIHSGFFAVNPAAWAVCNQASIVATSGTMGFAGTKRCM